ncbi:MAG: putative bifunctional diguanylate cyclase/phosphodiesterase [Actinomycetota bacterium]
MGSSGIAVTALVLLPVSVLLGVLAVLLSRHHREHERKARTDPLTGLGNRALLTATAERTLAELDRLDGDGSHGPVLLLLDLDGFKDVNDTLGHAAGDQVISQVAARLEAVVGTEGLVARLGGDEFAVLVSQPCTTAQATVLAKRLLAGLGAGGFLAGGVDLDVRASVGVAVAPQAGRHLAELLRSADIAMYEAKRSRAGVCAYTPDLSPETTDGLATLARLRGAMERGELLLLYQPAVDARTGEVHSYEALLRWRHPDRGLLLPAEFIALAERTSLIRPLSRWVLLTAVRQAAQWRAAGCETTISVNLSATMLEPGLLGIVEEALALNRWPAERLVLEVTETAISLNPDEARAVVSDLRAQGVKVSVDDFGAGFTGLGQLRGLRVEQLKIDRQFVTDLSRGVEDEAIVASIIELGHRLGLQVVAEGVETAEVARLLAEMGCDDLQGFHFAHPMPAEEVPAWTAGRHLTREAGATTG